MSVDWMTRGLCAKQRLEKFFPTDGLGVLIARKVCSSCPVKKSCLDHALKNKINHGIWGGCSERERRRILKQRHLRVDTEIERNNT